MTEDIKNNEIIVSAMYHFVRLEDLSELQKHLLNLMKSHDIMGTLIIAAEGLNGTVAGPPAGIKALHEFLRGDERFASLETKESIASEMPFLRRKVKIKDEIVTMGVNGIDPNHIVGTYVAPEEWNSLISDPDTVVIDTRNDYECHIGTFEGAINPKTQAFREFPEYVRAHLDQLKHKKVAMFCTGGIRCEKSTAYLKEQGVEEVYHLKGGILKYLENVPENESLWNGSCFVFDDRVAVDHGLKESDWQMCHACRMPITEEEMKSEQYERGVSCPHCFNARNAEQKNRHRERQKQIDLAKKRGEKHLGSS